MSTDKMREVKSSELIGPALDWAVAKSQGDEYSKTGEFGTEHWLMSTAEGCRRLLHRYSEDWGAGGPLISKHLLDFCVEHEDVICASLCDENGMLVSEYRYGETHLVAACRAIVAAKLGDVVQVPACLTEDGADKT